MWSASRCAAALPEPPVTQFVESLLPLVTVYRLGRRLEQHGP
jgi:hypothetical protein